MATAPDLGGEVEKAKVADETNHRLREAGFPETAITTWWMLLVDPKAKKTAYRVWESGDFATLSELVDKTLRNKATYRSAIQKLASKHWADRLSENPDVRGRLLGQSTNWRVGPAAQPVARGWLDRWRSLEGSRRSSPVSWPLHTGRLPEWQWRRGGGGGGGGGGGQVWILYR